MKKWVLEAERTSLFSETAQIRREVRASCQLNGETANKPVIYRYVSFKLIEYEAEE